MLIDLRKYAGPPHVRTDLCIVGAGAAGITLALEFARGTHEVCILESGALDYNARTQALADGPNLGLPYYPLRASRLRYFGGTTNHWAGIGLPLDAIDFEPRESIPWSGWPITRASLDGFYERAHVYCLRPNEYDPAYWATPEAPELPFEGKRIETRMRIQYPTRFGREYRRRLDAAANIRVFLAANVTQLETDPDGKAVHTVHARTLDGKSLSVSAKTVILATGAIENARLLLCNDRARPAGLGNDHDLVGRFFMEHPLVPSMEMQLSGGHTDLSLYTGQDRDGLHVTGHLALDPRTLRNEGLLNAAATLRVGGEEQPVTKIYPGIRSSIVIWNALKEGRWPRDFGAQLRTTLSDMNRVLAYSYERAYLRPPDLVSIVLQIEQAPNPDSRVLLVEETDELGMRKAGLDWRMGDLERHTVNRFGEILALETGRAGLGRVRLIPPEEGGWWTGMRGSWHQLGTTRMHTDPAQGVVDADCRVHGMDNLYVAGGSVFTTSGYANPTITIVALAIRLADHLKGLKS